MIKKKIIITGANGFIGQNFLNKLSPKQHEVINIDCITDASDRSVQKRFKWVSFKKINLCDNYKVQNIFSIFEPDLVINFAAHSHVDKSIKDSRIFLENINGTHNLLENSLKIFKLKKIKFLQISTDEVFGSIHKGQFNSKSAYRPNSPYSASKASSDHLVRAFNKTYGLPTLTTYSCNNYGPYQHLEKLIPLTIFSFLSKKKMGIYGNGNQKRQWIYVEDNIQALKKIINTTFDGATHCIGSKYEIDNISLVKKIIKILYKKIYSKSSFNYLDHIKYVKDRPGHDLRYFLEYKNLSATVKWEQKVNLDLGLEKTINWYLENKVWIKSQKESLLKFY